MRMLEHSQDPEFWVDFLKKIHGFGIKTLHSSIEYDSFPLLCETLRRLKDVNINFTHVIKLAEPSFDDNAFSKDRFLYKLETYRKMLKCDSIDTVQWMWRSSLEEDQQRINDFKETQSVISEAFAQGRLISTNIMCFPYSKKFAHECVKSDISDGLVIYWNPLEQEYLDIIMHCHSVGKNVYSIRPFAGGKVKIATNELLDFTFQQKGIHATILTATKPEHINCIMNYINNYEKIL